MTGVTGPQKDKAGSAAASEGAGSRPHPTPEPPVNARWPVSLDWVMSLVVFRDQVRCLEIQILKWPRLEEEGSVLPVSPLPTDAEEGTSGSLLNDSTLFPPPPQLTKSCSCT